VTAGAPRIDAHRHFWRPARGDYGWLTPDLAPLWRDFLPADAAPQLRARGIAGCVAVQAAETLAESRWLLEQAAANPWIVGVVGWVDVQSPTAVADAEALAARGPLVGLRPMLQDREPGWILDDRARPLLEWLAHTGRGLDALVRPQHLGAIDELVARHPDLLVVVDHAAKPALREGRGWAGFRAWSRGMATLARHGACVKLSGLLTEAAAGAGAAELRPAFDVLLEHFGPERMLWGSDWPVLGLAADHARWCDVTDELLAPLDDDDRAWVLGGAAARFYDLPAARGLLP
jgi:L-fuconolactonase